MRPSSLPASLDGLRLRAELAASTRSGWDKPAARQAALAKLKAYLEKGRALAESRLEGPGGGLEAARTLSGVMNAAIRALFDSVSGDLVHEGARAPGLALCALGGYGAGELAPRSDVDLLFLVSDPAPDHAEAAIERTLYALWDCGLHIGGGAVRSVDEAIALAAEDVSERTALLDVRSLTGDLTLVRELLGRFETELLAPRAAEFAAAKLEERDQRVERQGDSRYQVEPNVKDGKGGLRDLQTLRWLAQVLYGDDAMERWVGDGLFSVGDVERYLSAADFFWTVRFHVHDVVGRKDDRLTFDIQPEIAARMGFADTEDQLGVEAFMRAYFRKAIDVGALTRLVCAKLEADHLKDLPGNAGRFMPADGASGDADMLDEAGFAVRAGRLDFADRGAIERDPVLMLRLFEVAAARHIDLHPDAVAAVGQSLRLIDEGFRTDPRAARSFFAILLDADDPRMTLRAMTEAGLLGAYMPEFGDIVARTQFNMYHRFTVDEHTLNALGLLREIENGRHLADHPMSSKLISKIKGRRALHLAVLLHDTGKGKGDQCVEGAQNARIACDRLGLEDAETELVAWLIANHLEMSETAQRRDISDPRTVLDFAELCGSIERLRLLTILTVVDIRAVGPGVWNGWKAQLLRDLYEATAAVLKDGGANEGEAGARARLAERAETSRSKFRAAVNRLDAGFAERWSQGLEPSYWLAFSETDRLRHAAFARAAEARGVKAAAGVRVDRRRSATEVMVLAPDRDGLFADIAGALALQGANVVGAQVTTTADGRAFDVFFVQESGGKPYGWAHESLRDQLKAAVEAAALDGLPESCAIAERPIRRREAAFKVTPYVKLDETAADEALVIEASGRDRPGLLYDLARTLSDLGLSVEGARIDGYGERAVDTFYVTEKGQKPSDPDRLEAVRTALEAVLAEAEEAADNRAAAGLARAPASAGR
ncbi:MAG: [protein-PII] uridylyltransferase [Oceanicaulis sp.]